MDYKEWKIIFDSLAQAISAFLGIAAITTKTKDASGNLTKWGKTALAGIIITALFSTLSNLLDFKKDKDEKVTTDKKELKNEIEKKALMDSVNNLNKTLTRIEKAVPNSKNVEDAVNKLLARAESYQKELASTKDAQRNIETDLAHQKKIIRAFTAILKIEYSGNWEVFPFSTHVHSHPGFNYLKFSDSKGALSPITFKGEEVFFEEKGKTKAMMTTKLYIDQTQLPIENLSGYDQFSLLMNDIPRNDDRFRMVNVTVEFSLNNGQRKKTFVFPDFSQIKDLGKGDSPSLVYGLPNHDVAKIIGLLP